MQPAVLVAVALLAPNDLPILYGPGAIPSFEPSRFEAALATYVTDAELRFVAAPSTLTQHAALCTTAQAHALELSAPAAIFTEWRDNKGRPELLISVVEETSTCAELAAVVTLDPTAQHVYRVAALKLASVLRELRARATPREQNSPEPPVVVAPSPVAEPSPVVVEPAAESSGERAHVELGATIDPVTGFAMLELAGRLRSGPWSYGLQALLGSPVRHATNDGTGEVWSGGLSLSLQRRWEAAEILGLPVGIVGEVDPGVVTLWARAHRYEGARDTSRFYWMPQVTVSPRLDVQVNGLLSVSVGPLLDVVAHRVTLLMNDSMLLDSKWVRLRADIRLQARF